MKEGTRILDLFSAIEARLGVCYVKCLHMVITFPINPKYSGENHLNVDF
jgi:hypothetical protein